MRLLLIALVTSVATFLGGWAVGAWDTGKMATRGWTRVAAALTPEPPPPWADLEPGRSGTQRCVGCRSAREVHEHAGALEVTSLERGACGEWVLARLPVHEHAWSDVGCWTTVGDEGGITYALLAEDECFDVFDELWLAYLQAQPPDEVRRLVELATHDAPAFTELAKQIDAWRGR